MDIDGEKLPFIPQDVLDEMILPRLPVKSLLKFKSVSKTWYFIITSKRFVKNHLRYATEMSRLCYQWILFDTTEGFKKCFLPPLFKKRSIDSTLVGDFQVGFACKTVSLMGSYNGIVCLLIDCKRLILWNPSTQSSKLLPAFERKIAFSITAIGFGFDSDSDDYKVLGIAPVFADGLLTCAVCKLYSLKYNSWESIEITDFESLKDIIVQEAYHETAGKHANGLVYWCDKEMRLVSFNLTNHLWGRVKLPNYIEVDNYNELRLSVTNGCLTAHLFHRNGDLDIWTHNDFGVEMSWTKVAAIPFYKDLNFYSKPRPIFISPDGEVLIISGFCLAIYETGRGVFRQPLVNGLYPFHYLEMYTETLVSLDSNC